MKASILIKQLKEHIEKNGDTEVVISNLNSELFHVKTIGTYEDLIGNRNLAIQGYFKHGINVNS